MFFINEESTRRNGVDTLYRTTIKLYILVNVRVGRDGNGVGIGERSGAGVLSILHEDAGRRKATPALINVMIIPPSKPVIHLGVRLDTAEAGHVQRE